MADENLTERGARHSLEGTGDKLKGHVKDAVGGLTGDKSTQAEGKWDQVKGKAKDALGDAERSVDRKLNQ